MLTILTVFFNFDPILNFNNYIQNNIFGSVFKQFNLASKFETR